MNVRWKGPLRNAQGARFFRAFDDKHEFLTLCERSSDPDLYNFKGPFTRWVIFEENNINRVLGELPNDLTDDEVKSASLVIWRLRNTD